MDGKNQKFNVKTQEFWCKQAKILMEKNWCKKPKI